MAKIVNANRTDRPKMLGVALGHTRLHTTLPLLFFHTYLYLGRLVTLHSSYSTTMWEMKKLKMDRNETAEQRLNGLNDVD